MDLESMSQFRQSAGSGAGPGVSKPREGLRVGAYWRRLGGGPYSSSWWPTASRGLFGALATSGGTRARDGRCVRGPASAGRGQIGSAAGEVRAYPGDVNTKPTEIAREGLEAWRKGDFETIEEILDPNVEWRWFEPGGWDCHGRDEVIRTLRERYEQGFARGELEFRDGGEQAVIVVSHPSEIGGPDWPSETATVMQFRNKRVVSMQDYRTEAEAIAAVNQS